MSTKLLFSLLTAAVVLSPATSAQGSDREHRGSHDSFRPQERDYRDHQVWSGSNPRPHYRVNHLPPPRRHEWQPGRPSYRHVWLPGSWRWREGYGDWIWIGGYWALPPRENVIFVEPRYEQVGSDVVYVDGGWCEESYVHDDSAATGAVLGGVLGGVIGHQSRNTGIGVIAGAIVGSLIGHEADRDRSDRQAEAARDRAAQVEAAKAQADANARLEREKTVAQGRGISEQELTAAQERARIAREKLASAKAAREAEARQSRNEQETALGRAAALEKANADAAAAEAELQALQRSGH